MIPRSTSVVPPWMVSLGATLVAKASRSSKVAWLVASGSMKAASSIFVPEELERCGKAGIKAAVILSSGFAEELGAAGAGLQDRVRAIRYRNVCGETSCPRREGWVEMDENAAGFAVALPLFLVIAVGIAVWVHRMRG